MKNPLTRLYIYGVGGLGVSTAMIVENYISKKNTIWEYILGGILFVFSIVFLVARYKIIKKNK